MQTSEFYYFKPLFSYKEKNIREMFFITENNIFKYAIVFSPILVRKPPSPSCKNFLAFWPGQ